MYIIEINNKQYEPNVTVHVGSGIYLYYSTHNKT